MTGNTLIKVGKDENVRINAWYLPYQTEQSYSSETKYMLPDSSYSQYENQQMRTTGKEIHSSFDYKANKKKFYLEDKLDFELKDETVEGTLQTEKSFALQKSDLDSKRLENNFRLVKTFGKQFIFELFSKSGYVTSPEGLFITPGIYENILNNGRFYQASFQNVKKNAFYSRNTANLRVNDFKIKQLYELGYNFENITLRSSTLVQNDSVSAIPLDDAFRNHLEWNSSQTRVTAGYNYSFKNLNISTSLPLNYRIIESEDRLRQQDTVIKKLIFEPTLNFKLQLSAKHNLQLGINRSVSFGRPEDMLSGNIIRNYRTVQQNNFILNDGKQYSGNLFYSYREPIKIFFTNIAATYSRGSYSTIVRSLLQSDGLIKTDRIFYDNINERWMVMANISKYIFDWKSTLRLGLNWSQFKQSQIQNNYIIPLKNQSLSLELEFDAKLSERFNFNYNGSYQISRNWGTEASLPLSNKVLSGTQKLTATYFIKPELYLQSYNEYRLLRSDQTKGNIFLNDLKIQYTLPKTKTDVGLLLTNTFNKKNYLYESLDFTSSVIQAYSLRPRTVLLNVRFIL